MATHAHSNPSANNEEQDLDIIAMWIRFDPKRWIAGALAGATAGLIMAAVAMAMATAAGLETWFPVKLAAIPFLGGEATTLGTGTPGLIIGFIAHEALCMLLGVVYAHFTVKNYMPALLGAGITWGLFSWIFLSNLFFQSFPEVNAAGISRGAALLCNLVFGISLASVAGFDRMFRR
jgi:hypothetical protein